MGTYLAGTAVTITETFTILGVPTNPTTVTFSVEEPDLTIDTYVFGVAPEVTNPSVGVFKLNLPAQTQIGVYHYSVQGTGLVAATSQGDFTIFPLSSQPGEPGYGPCTPWVDASDVASCAGVEHTSENNDLLAAQAVSASQVMFMISGKQFRGLCEATVRPCRPTCSCWGVQYLDYAQGGSRPIWAGYNWWWSDRSTSCGCGCDSRVKLYYPVQSVTEVLIDGVVLNPDEYEVVRKRYLVRKNNAFWPACQDLSLDDTEAGTWSVTFFWGREAPLAGKQAAAQLGAELYSACTTGECKLPSKATRVVRNGLTIERLQPLAQMLLRGDTGLPAIDTFLAAWNPNQLKRPPTISSPLSYARYPRPVG